MSQYEDENLYVCIKHGWFMWTYESWKRPPRKSKKDGEQERKTHT